MAEPTIVHEFDLGRRGVVRSSITEFRGRRFADLRLWVEPRDQPRAALIPTRKGISIPVEHMDELLESLQAIADQVAQPVPRRGVGS